MCMFVCVCVCAGVSLFWAYVLLQTVCGAVRLSPPSAVVFPLTLTQRAGVLLGTAARESRNCMGLDEAADPS